MVIVVEGKSDRRDMDTVVRDKADTGVFEVPQTGSNQCTTRWILCVL